MSVTCKVLEKISGITSTPTFKDLARIKGSLLNAGSSAIERSSAETLPDRMERLEIADFDLPAERIGQLRFEFGAETIYVDQEGKSNDDEQKDRNHDPDNFQMLS